MDKLRTLIIDDEEPCIQVLSVLLTDYHTDVLVLDTAMSMDDGIKKIEAHKDIDIVFLDVRMPGGDGFALLEKLSEIPFKVIFTTAYNEYAIKAIKFSALDYLLKPIDDDDLSHAIQKYRNTRNHGGSLNTEVVNLKKALRDKRTFEKIPVPTLSEVRFIPVQRIMYLESDNNYTFIYLDDNHRILSSRNLGHYEELLESYAFLRIHKSYLVNMEKVIGFIKGKSGFLQMESGTRLEISSRRKEEVMNWLGI